MFSKKKLVQLVAWIFYCLKLPIALSDNPSLTGLLCSLYGLHEGWGLGAGWIWQRERLRPFHSEATWADATAEGLEWKGWASCHQLGGGPALVGSRSGAVLLSAARLSGDPMLLSFPAEACGGSGDNASHAALRRVVRRFHACLNGKFLSRLLSVFVSAFFVEFE